MDAHDPVDDDFGGGLPELCDLCGAIVVEGGEVFDLVPDSSSVFAGRCEFDGWRLVTGCSREHVDMLVEEYRRRPFVEEEQWAARIERALERHGGDLSADHLAEATGLARHEIDRAIAWLNARPRDWRGRCDNGTASP